MFRCRDGQCVTRHSRCDFAKDCFDGSDEFDCQSKSFLCLCVCVSVFMIKLFHSTFFICLFLSLFSIHLYPSKTKSTKILYQLSAVYTNSNVMLMVVVFMNRWGWCFPISQFFHTHRHKPKMIVEWNGAHSTLIFFLFLFFFDELHPFSVDTIGHNLYVRPHNENGQNRSIINMATLIRRQINHVLSFPSHFMCIHFMFFNYNTNNTNNNQMRWILRLFRLFRRTQLWYWK